MRLLRRPNGPARVKGMRIPNPSISSHDKAGIGTVANGQWWDSPRPHHATWAEDGKEAGVCSTVWNATGLRHRIDRKLTCPRLSKGFRVLRS